MGCLVLITFSIRCLLVLYTGVFSNSFSLSLKAPGRVFAHTSLQPCRHGINDPALLLQYTPLTCSARPRHIRRALDSTKYIMRSSLIFGLVASATLAQPKPLTIEFGGKDTVILTGADGNQNPGASSSASRSGTETGSPCTDSKDKNVNANCLSRRSNNWGLQALDRDGWRGSPSLRTKLGQRGSGRQN